MKNAIFNISRSNFHFLTVLLMLLTSCSQTHTAPPVHYKTQKVGNLNIFYREAGEGHAQTIVLLHGFPTSSHMYRNLLPLLAQHYHVIAPDYPGFGYSDTPSPKEYHYSFDALADTMEQFLQNLGLRHYALYMQDYGGPVGLRIAAAQPEKIQALIMQNANAYAEGLSPVAQNFMDTLAANPDTDPETFPLFQLEATKMQYLQGAQHPERISPDAWQHAQWGMDRAGNKQIQMALSKDYSSNVHRYESWHTYFRRYQPPALILWGKNDFIFTVEGAKAYLKDLPEAQLHILEGGHFVLEEKYTEIYQLIDRFMQQSHPTLK